MSKFHIGQRVRITANYVTPSLVGRAAVITSRDDYGALEAWRVDVEGFGPDYYSHNGIEPINDAYDGNTITAWAESPWQPKVHA